MAHAPKPSSPTRRPVRPRTRALTAADLEAPRESRRAASRWCRRRQWRSARRPAFAARPGAGGTPAGRRGASCTPPERKSTPLNSRHSQKSYAGFFFEKKKQKKQETDEDKRS